MAKQRELSELEQAARKKYGGLTRREYNAKHSKFAKLSLSKGESGSFEVVALFEGNPAPQTAPFPNELAALARFERLSTNPNVQNVKVVKHVSTFDAEGKALTHRQVALYSLIKLGQEFANSKQEILFRRKGANDGSLISEQAIWKSPKLTKEMAEGQFELAKFKAHGGQAWWERRA